MNLFLYRNKSERNVIGKELVDVNNMEIHLKRTVNIDSPYLRLSWSSDIDTADYALIDYTKNGVNVKKYYFVDIIETGNPNIVEMQLRLDVLETYKDAILGGRAIVTMSEIPTYFDTVTDQETRLEIEKIDGDTTLETTLGTTIVHTIGVG